MPPVRKRKSTEQSASTSNDEPAVVSGQLDKKIKKQQQKKLRERGVVFIKHLPHGFFEKQLKMYFEQFGIVTRLRLCRSKRTGGSKGYAFVEFEYPEVAQVAAETMDNYLMFKKVVKAEYIPPDKQHFNYFKTSLRKVKNKAGKDVYVSAKSAAIQRKMKQHNDWSDESYQKRTVAKLRKINKLNAKYAHLGIDFSKVVMQPQKVEVNSKASTEDEKASTSDTNLNPSVSKSLPNKKKNVKTSKESNALKNSKKVKKSVELEDLLGNTLNDDSDDEDYIAIAESDDDVDEDEDEEVTTSSDEETYGFTKDSDDDGEEDDDDDDDDDEGTKTSKKEKSVKSSKANRFESLVKRKPHTGAIQKIKKGPKKLPPKKEKTLLQMAAAKEMMHAMPQSKRPTNIKRSNKKKVKN